MKSRTIAFMDALRPFDVERARRSIDRVNAQLQVKLRSDACGNPACPRCRRVQRACAEYLAGTRAARIEHLRRVHAIEHEHAMQLVLVVTVSLAGLFAPLLTRALAWALARMFLWTGVAL